MKLCNNIICTKENINTNMSKKIYKFLSKWEADVQISQKGETKEIGQTGVFVKSKNQQPSDPPHFIIIGYGNRKPESIKK
jgi:hypothetical protein